MKELIYLFSICCLWLCSSCDDSDDPVFVSKPAVLDVTSESPLLTLQEDGTTGTIRFKTRGGEINLNIETNQENWDYTLQNDAWLTVEKSEKSLKIQAERNTTAVSPSAALLLTAGEGDNTATFLLEIVQNAFGDPEITAFPNPVYMVAQGDSLRVEVALETNLDEWHFDGNCSWLLVEEEENRMFLTADLNPDTISRKTSLTLTGGYGEKTAEETVVVIQEARVYILSNPISLSFDEEGEEKHIEITSNYEWTYTSEADWYTVKRENNSLVVKAKPNKEAQMRTAHIVLTAGKGQNVTTQSIPISQIGYNANNLVLVYDIPADNSVAMLPIAGTLDCQVDWGDGTIEQITTANPTHTYISKGKYNIVISGKATALNSYSLSGDQRKYIIRVKQWGKTGLESLEYAFYNCENLKSIPTDIVRSFEAVTTFSNAFYNCYVLECIPEGLFDNATKATNFDFTFASCQEIASIPANLFVNNKAAQSFGFTFNRMGAKSDDLANGKLKEIPAGLFRNNTEALSFAATFGSTAIKTVPADLFVNCTKANDFKSLFTRCVLLESVPANLFANNPSVTTFYNIFNSCEKLTSISADIFKNNKLVNNFNNAFSHTALEEVPQGLFDGMTQVTTYFGCFQSCPNLKTIPADLFKDAVAVTTMGRLFANCPEIKTVPENLFDNCSKLKEVSYLFMESGIENVPEKLFAKCTSLTNASYCFQKCNLLKQVPAGLFRNNSALSNVSNLFIGSGITSVPEELFQNNPKITSFTNTFKECSLLTEIPEGLFRANTSVTSFSGTFSNCTSLGSIPEKLFIHNEKVTSFTSVFNECTGLKSIPAGLFDGNLNVTNFSKAFLNCTLLSGESPYTLVEGNKIHLYERTAALGFKVPSTYTNCFTGCTGLSDYESIPSAWK